MEDEVKKIGLIIVVLIILLAIPVTVFVANQQQELRKKAAPATTLALTPTSSTKKVNDVFSLDARIDTGENQVAAAEVHFVFDPEKLEAVTITNGSSFPNILSSGTVGSGTASIAVGSPGPTTPFKGVGTVATVKFRAVAATSTPVSVKFGSNTFVSAIGESATNVLVGSTPATVTITGEAASAPTPSPTASLGLTPTATPTPAASPSAVLILTPAKDASVSGQMPTISGKAPAGATVTITIYSTPTTVTVTADANGNWKYTPTVPLESGPHTIVASAQDPASGTNQTASSSFVVAGTSGSSTATGSAVPVSGTVEITLLLVSVGIVVMMAGAFVPIFIR